MSQPSSEDIVARIEKAFARVSGQKETSSDGSLIMHVNPNRLVESITILAGEFGIKHLSTITGVDAGQSLELNYHFWYGNRIITVKTAVPKTDPKIQTCVSIIPGAILYEMENHDMFGVIFENNPWMNRKLLLPENYPSDMPPPLLKETSPEKIRKSLGLEK